MAAHYHLFKYLRKKQNKTKVDHLMSAAAVIFPLTAVPQVIQLYSSRQATGVSLSMWVGFLVFGIVFLCYGIAHRLKPYILMQILWITVDVAMLVGILRY